MSACARWDGRKWWSNGKIQLKGWQNTKPGDTNSCRDFCKIWAKSLIRMWYSLLLRVYWEEERMPCKWHSFPMTRYAVSAFNMPLKITEPRYNCFILVRHSLQCIMNQLKIHARVAATTENCHVAKLCTAVHECLHFLHRGLSSPESCRSGAVKDIWSAIFSHLCGLHVDQC